MVVTTGDFSFQTGEWGILDDRDNWHAPLPASYFITKTVDKHPPTLRARREHKGSHRAHDRNLVQWCKNLTIRMAILTFAVYYYFATALVLKGADAAHGLFQVDTALVCATGVSFVAYMIQRNKLAAKKAARQPRHAVYVMNATSDDNGFITTHERRVTVTSA